jgi:uncharacterized protein (DUF433 family)
MTTNTNLRTEILKMLAAGHSFKTIAEKYGLTVKAVRRIADCPFV